MPWRILWFVFTLSHFQAAVEVPQYLGVNLLVEGATIKRSRHYRQSFISNSPLPHQVHPEQLSQAVAEPRHKQFSQKPHAVADFPLLGKESQVKKSQMTSTCPKREHDRKAERQNTCPVRKSCRSVACEQPASVHTEPQKKAQRLGLRRRVSGATLVPRSLSFSLDPACCTSEGKHQSIHHHASHTSKSFLSQRSSEPQHKISSRVFPSLQGPLPTLEIFQLQPNIVTGTNVCHNSAFLSHPTTHKHQLCLNSQRQVKARHKGELTEEHKYKRCWVDGDGAQPEMLNIIYILMGWSQISRISVSLSICMSVQKFGLFIGCGYFNSPPGGNKVSMIKKKSFKVWWWQEITRENHSGSTDTLIHLATPI